MKAPAVLMCKAETPQRSASRNSCISASMFISKHPLFRLGAPKLRRFRWALATGSMLCAGLLGVGLLLTPPAGAQTHPAGQRTIQIAAAADLEPILPAVLQRFEQQTGIHATATYQSSATLAQQILNGAPFDIFFAADMGFPQHIVDFGAATERKPVAYARGTLVLWARKDAPVLHGGPLSFAVLRNPALRSVAIANPEHAPYGRAAKAAIATMHLDSTLNPKLRVAQNIAQAAQYADSGNAEVGFLSLTGASTAKLKADGTFLPVPPETYPPIIQGAVVLKHGANAADAERLLHFFGTRETEKQLAAGGLLPPE